MSIERSPYEGKADRLNGKNCLARVTSVDTDNRTLNCRTLGSQEDGTDDQNLFNVKVIHTAWNTNGAYGLYLPQIGEYVLVTYINSEPVSLGSYPLSVTFGGGQLANQTDSLQPGDWGFVGVGTAIGGSRLIVRSAGTVEIESTKNCRTYWLPTNDTINTVCQNYELEPAGGYWHWTVDQDSGDTVSDLKAFDSVTADNGVRLQMGTTSSGALLDLAMGPTDDNLDISAPTLALQIQKDGTTNLDIGGGKFVANITPAGEVTVTADATQVTTKAYTQNSTDIAVNASGSVKSVADSSQSFKAPTTAIGDGSIELLAQLSDLIDALGQVQILTRVGLAAPMEISSQWTQVLEIQAKIKTITGSF